jgi:hypothetical protein
MYSIVEVCKEHIHQTEKTKYLFQICNLRSVCRQLKEVNRIMTFVREVPDLGIGQDNDNPGRGFSWFSSVSAGKCNGSAYN